MASEPSDRDATAAGLPEPLDTWLEQRAGALGVPREEVLAGLVGGYRQVVEADADAGEPLEGVDLQTAADVEARTGRLEERLDTLEAEFDTKLDEIRRHVVALKSQVDERADADHDHGSIERLDEIAEDVDRLKRVVASNPEATGGGASAERIEGLEEKVTRLASAVVALREAGGRTREEPGAGRREALRELKRQAARTGVESAECDACGNEVHIALLTEPACPHCETEMREVTPASGWLFGTATITGGTDGTGVDDR